MSKYDFTVPGRQSTIGLLLFFGTSVRKFFKVFWPVIVIYIIKDNTIPDDKKYFIYLGIAFLISLIIINSVLTFYYFFFYIENDEFVVRKGYLKKVKLSIPLSRIQTINIKQNVFQQILKVVTLEIDTAGSAKMELKLVALKSEQAVSLQNCLTVDKKIDDETESVNEQIQNSSRKLIFRLLPGDLLKVGISENHLKSSLLVLAVVYGFFNQLKDLFVSWIEITQEDVSRFLTDQNVSFILGLIIFILIIGFLFSIISAFLKYYDFSFFRTRNEFIINSGLLTKKGVAIPYSKIQVVSWVTNPLRTMMNFVTVSFSQASSNENNKKQNIAIPGCSFSNKELIDKEIFDVEESPVWDKHYTHLSYIWRLWFLRGWLPAIPAGFIWFDNNIAIIIIAVWLLVSLIYSYFSIKKRYFRISMELFESSKGTIAQQFSMIFNFKIQSLRFKQSIFQKLKHRATIKVYTAGGRILTIPFISEQIAIELYNYLLYKVETTNEKWM